MLLAIDRGDYPRASEARRQLGRLGWSVVPRKPRGTTRKPTNPEHVSGPLAGVMDRLARAGEPRTPREAPGRKGVGDGD